MTHSILDILPKLDKLVPRLSSPADGEVVATVRAIDRALRGAGLDWHDLARTLRAGAALSAPSLRERDADLGTVAAWCLHNGAGRLNWKEHDFIQTIATRLSRGGSTSEKQRVWLWAIHDRISEMEDA